VRIQPRHPAPTAPTAPSPPRPLPRPSPPRPPPRYSPVAQHLAIRLPLGHKFAASSYAARYTLQAEQTRRPIISIGDLRDFDTHQSEFSEYSGLGDISTRYPSLSRLYLGAISRVLVAVPAHYGIARSVHGTQASCRALLDMSATGGGACMFQFGFTIAPSISPVELLQLTREIAATPAVRDCTVVLPSELDPRGGSTLTTAYLNNATYNAGAAPGSFQIAGTITDRSSAPDALRLPAVAVANQFIQQLVSQPGPFLVGTLRLRLDDDYPSPVEASVVLNFQVTSGGDELLVEQTPDGIALTNASPLDLQLHRLAIRSGTALRVVAFEHALPAGQRAIFPADPSSADPAGAALQVAVDRELALHFPLAKSDVARCLPLDVKDVQDIQYQVGVSAGSVDFHALGIAHIQVAVSLTDLPQLTVPAFTLVAMNRSGTEQVFLPVQDAIGSLDGVAAFTVEPADAAVPAVRFTISNDFLAQPVVVLTAAHIPAFPAAPDSTATTPPRDVVADHTPG
jgi:hypothetical protein